MFYHNVWSIEKVTHYIGRYKNFLTWIVVEMFEWNIHPWAGCEYLPSPEKERKIRQFPIIFRDYKIVQKCIALWFSKQRKNRRNLWTYYLIIRECFHYIFWFSRENANEQVLQPAPLFETFARFGEKWNCIHPLYSRLNERH